MCRDGGCCLCLVVGGCMWMKRRIRGRGGAIARFRALG